MTYPQEKSLSVAPHMIPPYEEFEVVEAEGKGLQKAAYGNLYDLWYEDLEIELEWIATYEVIIDKTGKELDSYGFSLGNSHVDSKKYRAYLLTWEKLCGYKEKIKFHYRKAIAIISPKMAQGWHRWADDILHLFVSEKLHKVLWGSGNCGKSAVMALLLYIKWRVMPDKRMVILVSRIFAEATERVSSYIEKIHTEAPQSNRWLFNTSARSKGNIVSCMMYDKDGKKWIANQRARIVHLPVKGGRGEEIDLTKDDIGSNLLGRHPDNRLILAFDEAQEHRAVLRRQKIFLNWYTNMQLDVYAWGNPIPVDVHNNDIWDLLFRMGAPVDGTVLGIDVEAFTKGFGRLKGIEKSAEENDEIDKEQQYRKENEGASAHVRRDEARDETELLNQFDSTIDINKLKDLEKVAHKTSTWSWSNTDVLHLSMLESPKDIKEEKEWSGVWEKTYAQQVGRRERLEFLAGKDVVDRLIDLKQAVEGTPGWYSQVLGFPYLMFEGSGAHPTVLLPANVKVAQEYKLFWKKSEKGESFKWLVGVDPAITGSGDSAEIVVGKMGMMMDGRMGIDLMNGRHCQTVEKVDSQNFTDTIIDVLWKLSQELGFGLKDIIAEVHSAGEVFRYAMQKHIENGRWLGQYTNGDMYEIVSPVVPPSDRLLFKDAGVLIPAKDICADCNTEYWVAVKCGVLNRQIFNIPERILRQYYNRYLLHNANGVKYKLESKIAMRKRGVRSPNAGDAMAFVLELARRKGFKYRFYNTHAYQKVYGTEYELRRQQTRIEQRLGQVGKMLGISENLGRYANDEYWNPDLKKRQEQNVRREKRKRVDRVLSGIWNGTTNI